MPASNKPLCEEKNCRKVAACEIQISQSITLNEETQQEEKKPFTMCFCSQHANEFLYGSSKNTRWAYEQGYGMIGTRIWLLQ